MQSILVCRPNHLTVDWAQRVVNKHNFNAVVSKVDIVLVDIGTTTRIRVKVEHNKPDKLPKDWFVKLPSLDWKARLITALPRLLHTEVRFYNEVLRPVSVIIPNVLAAQSHFGKGATLVLPDLTGDEFILGTPGDDLTVAQAGLVVEQLARFHAHFGREENLSKSYQWLAGPVRRLEDVLGSALAVPLMKRGLRKAGDLVPVSLHAQAIHYARNRKKAMQFLTDAPQTLVHHDCHPGNLYWYQSKPGILDWQMVRFGEGISDIAYFLATSLTIENRRRSEIDLIEIYAQSLKDNGMPNLDAKVLLKRYRAHLIYAFEAMLVTLAIGDMMDLESNYELIRRTVAAVQDLDAFNAIRL